MVRGLEKLRRFFFGTFRRQLVICVAVVQAVMMVLFIWDLTQRHAELHLDRQVEQATALSEALAVSTAGWLAADNVAGLQEIVNAQRNYPELAFAILVDQRGQILAHTEPSRVGEYLQDLPAAPRVMVLSRSRDLVDVLSPAILGGRHVGWARIGISQKLAWQKQAALSREGLLYALGAVVLGTLLAWGTVWRFTRRLYVVQRTIDAVQAGNSKARAKISGSDEVAAIAREFDDMLDALAERDAVLQRLHRQNELILNAAGEGIYGVNAEGEILFANPAVCRMLAYQLEELIGKNSHQLFHNTRADGTPYPPDDCPLRKSLRSGVVMRGQDEIFWAGDGRMLPVEFVTSPVIEGGAVIGGVVVVRDISERKQAEQAKQRERQRLYEVLETLPVYVVLLTRDYQVQFANRFFRERFGESQGRRCFEFLFGRSEPCEICETFKVIQTGKPHTWEWLGPDNHNYEVFDYLFTDYDGSPMVMEMGIDITERKQAEEALRLSAARLAEAQRLAHLGHWDLDLSRNQLIWSDEIYRIFGAQPQEFAATYEAFLERIHPEDREKVDQAYHESLEKRSNFEIEHRIVLPHGDIKYVQECCTTDYDPISGTPLRSLGTVQDVTERKRLEAQLRQAQKMEAIGTLAGGIAHDFNNILTAILGFGEIVMDQLPKDSPLRQEQEHVLRSGARAKELVKQILTFSRRSEQELQPLLMQFVVKEALKLLRSSIPATIEMREEIDVEIAPVLADPTQIHQVVMNLCTNAYQAMRETGGVMTVTLKSLAISEVEAAGRGNLLPGNYALLEVSDTGCGMSRAVQERIFEPYFTTRAKGEGTGLGLSLVHGIVTGLGGVVNVYSEPGQGATFKVYLPLISGKSIPPVEEKSEVVPGGKESLLVVDDEEAITRLERKLLEGLGYKVAVFVDSALALQAFQDNPQGFDLVLTDMTMPRLNGDELARSILKVRPGMPIIICTGFSELIDAEKAKDLGVKILLQKPVEKGDLARAVRRALDDDVSNAPE